MSGEHRGPTPPGHRSDLDRLVERCLPGLFAFVRARAGPALRARDATHDLVQSACYEALRDVRLNSEIDDARFRHRLYLAAERKIVDRARFHAAERRDRARELSAAEVDSLRTAWSEVITPSRDAAAREEIERFEAALARLPADQREVIVLARLVGLPHAAIGERLGKSPGAVRVALHRALARLSSEMESS